MNEHGIGSRHLQTDTNDIYYIVHTSINYNLQLFQLKFIETHVHVNAAVSGYRMERNDEIGCI